MTGRLGAARAVRLGRSAMAADRGTMPLRNVALITGTVAGTAVVVTFAVTASGPLHDGSMAVIILGAVGSTVAAIVGETSARRRRDDIAAWVRWNGWRYEERSVVFPGGGGTEVIRGEVGGIRIASYVGLARPEVNGHAPVVAPHHVLVASLPAAFPALSLTPAVPGVPADVPHDIDFESAEFNARWRVRCDDERFAHAFCHPRLMQRLLCADAAGLSVYVEGREIAVTAPGVTDPMTLPARAVLLADLVRMVPAHVAADYAATPSARRPRRRAAGHGSFFGARGRG